MSSFAKNFHFGFSIIYFLKQKICCLNDKPVFLGYSSWADTNSVCFSSQLILDKSLIICQNYVPPHALLTQTTRT